MKMPMALLLVSLLVPAATAVAREDYPAPVPVERLNPSASTIAILAQIKADGVDAALHHDLPLSLPQLSGRLRQFQMRLAELQKQIQKDIELVEHFLPNRIE